MGMSSAETEKKNWHAIYTELPKAMVVKLPQIDDSSKGQDACLCMPYLIPIESQKRQTEDIRVLIKTCLKEFAKRQYHHNEVKWRHLGFFGIGKSRKLYLCDLSNLKKRDTESDDEWAELTKEWINKSLRNLGFSILEDKDKAKK